MISYSETRACPKCNLPVKLPDFFWGYEIHNKEVECKFCHSVSLVKHDSQLVYGDNGYVDDEYDLFDLELK